MVMTMVILDSVGGISKLRRQPVHGADRFIAPGTESPIHTVHLESGSAVAPRQPSAWDASQGSPK